MSKRSYSDSARGQRIVRYPFLGVCATVVMPSSRCEDGVGASNLTSRNRGRHSTPLQTINSIHYNQEYEALKARQVSALELHSLSELPDLLIKARIARGYTQAELAKRLHLKPQQLQRYEATRYDSVSFRRLLEIARALDVDLSETVRLTR